MEHYSEGKEMSGADELADKLNEVAEIVFKHDFSILDLKMEDKDVFIKGFVAGYVFYKKEVADK